MVPNRLRTRPDAARGEPSLGLLLCGGAAAALPLVIPNYIGAFAFFRTRNDVS